MMEFLTQLRQGAIAALNERTLREQMLLAAMAVLALGLLFYLLIARPVITYHETSRSAYLDAMGRYRALEAGLADYARFSDQARARPDDDRPLRSVIGATALDRDIQIARILPDEEGRLNVWIDRIPSADLMAWLIDLEQRFGIAASRVTIDRESDDVVSVQLVLSRGGVG
jgi:type II secretory pathway component PulM